MENARVWFSRKAPATLITYDYLSGAIEVDPGSSNLNLVVINGPYPLTRPHVSTAQPSFSTAQARPQPLANYNPGLGPDDFGSILGPTMLHSAEIDVQYSPTIFDA